MNTVFVINPKAGKGEDIQKLVDTIKNESANCGKEAETYITRAVGDAERFVREYCKTHGAARFIACGGDGTLSEVLNGAIECDGAQIGVMPFGTGNDFCRNFSCSGDFLSVPSQLNGESTKCDAIRYTTYINSAKKTGYCINMVNIGFDCNVAYLTAEMKKKPFIFGPMAYFLSIFVSLINKKGANLSVELDGRKIHCGPLLLTSIANGSYCGGGIKSNPLADVTEGLVNINIIYNISRLNFLTKLPFYMKGTHTRLRGIEKVIFTTKGKKVTITPEDGKMLVCIDGEIFTAGKTEFEIVHNAFDFVLPQKEKMKENKKEVLHV